MRCGACLVALHVDHDRDRAVEPGPEALREQVVRATARLLLGLRALVGGAEPDERRGAREEDARDEQDREDDPRVPRHEPAPAREQSPLACGFRVVDRAQERHLEPVDLVAEQREDGEQEGVRKQHRRQDAERAPDPELRHEVEAEEREPGHRDRDRQPGEQHRAARRRAGLGGRVARLEPLVEELPEARDDEQRVVDPDAEPDHRHEDRRDGVDVGQPGEDEEEEERGRQRHDREHDRDDRGDERPEHDEEHDQCREQAEQLGRPLLDRRELRLAVVLDRHADGLHGRPHGIFDGDHRVAVLVLDRLVELRLGVGDAPALREGLRAERVVDARQLRFAVDGLGALRRDERRGAELRHRLLDRCLALRRVEALALGRREDDVEHASLLRRELRLDQVGRTLGVGAGDLELVPKPAADRGDEADEDHDDPEPRSEDAPRVRRAGSRPTRERPGRHAFVRGQARTSVPTRGCRVLAHEPAPSLTISFTSPRIPCSLLVQGTAVRPRAGSVCRTLATGLDAGGRRYSSVRAEC